MVDRLVISINMSRNMLEYLHIMPDSGVKMVKKIIYQIDCDKRIKVTRYKVLVVLGRLNEKNALKTVNLSSCPISWDYSYFTSCHNLKVTKAMDKAVSTIIIMAIREVLWDFYSWDSPFSDM